MTQLLHRLTPRLLVPFVLALALASACGDDDRSRRTGVPQVDTIIGGVESGDRALLEERLQYTNLPCSSDAALIDRPRCEGGETAGANIDAIQVIACETGWLRRDDMGPVLDAVMSLEPEIYAAFETPDGFYVSGRYAVVFEGEDVRADDDVKRYVAMGIEADQGRITGLALGCGIGEPAHFLLPHLNEGFDDWLIEP